MNIKQHQVKVIFNKDTQQQLKSKTATDVLMIYSKIPVRRK